jgi:hypothetical protein
MPTIEFSITVPEGTSVKIVGLEDAVPRGSDEDRLHRYWQALSDNGRMIFAAAARIESHKGPGFTLEDIAENLSLPYGSVRSMHRSTGRTAKAWRRDTGTDEPIKLEWEDYDWDGDRDGHRTSYHLPIGIADAIIGFAAEG